MSGEAKAFVEFWESLSTEDKETVLVYAYERRPRPYIKLRKLLGYEDTGSAFDVDLADGQTSEQFVGKYEFKKDFRVSDTGNVAIEVECRGNLSGLSITEADWWVICFSGPEYRDEVKVIIDPDRLRKITRGCCRKTGGDDGAALLALVPKHKLLLSSSEIERENGARDHLSL